MENTKYCQVCKKCNGCQLSNLDYQSQIKYKQTKLRLTFNRLTKPRRIIAAQSPLNYRNKAQLVFKKEKGRTCWGIYQSAEKGVVLTDYCPLHSKKSKCCSKNTLQAF